MNQDLTLPGYLTSDTRQVSHVMQDLLTLPGYLACNMTGVSCEAGSVCPSVWWCLMPLSTIFQLYHGSQFYWWRKPEYSEKTTDLLHNVVIHLAPIEIRTTSVVIGTECIGSCKSNYHVVMTTTTLWNCFFAKHTALMSKSKDCLYRNQDKVSEWNTVSINRLASVI